MENTPINPIQETQPATNNPTPNKPATKQTSGGFAIVSFVLTMIPILLISYVIAAGHGESEGGDGAIGWLIIIYYWSVGFPIFVLSIIFAIIGLKSPRKPLAIASLIIKFTAPISIIILSLIFGLFV